jgi:hypothetical protein
MVFVRERIGCGWSRSSWLGGIGGFRPTNMLVRHLKETVGEGIFDKCMTGPLREELDSRVVGD